MILSKEQNKKFLNNCLGFTGFSNLYNYIIKMFGNGIKTESVLYDQSVSGNITTSANLTTDLVLPVGAIVRGIVIDTLTNVDSASDTATLTISVADTDTEEGAGTIVTGITQANLQVGSYLATATSVKIKADTELLLKAGTEDITAGKFRIFVDYYLSID